jgi:protein SCO1/2
MLRQCLTTGCLIMLAFPASLPADVAAVHDHGATNGTVVSLVNYAVPQIDLVRENGRTVALPKELDDGRPVVMNFIFTTCETTCPLSSATFSMFEKELGPERRKVHLISISIDPEQDTPARLRAYAKRFGAGPEWQFYTGTLAASLAAQQAFAAYRGDKMSHAPLTLMRAAPGRAWLRIEGFATPDQLLQHYRELLAAP